MGKVLEGPAKRLLARHGVAVPKGLVTNKPDFKAPASGRLVVKANVALGGRGKRGLVAVCPNFADAKKQARRILGTKVEGHAIPEVLVEEAIAYEAGEHFVALSETRDGLVLFLAAKVGGVDVEGVWETHVKKLEVAADDRPDLAKFVKQAGFGDKTQDVCEFVGKLIDCFWAEDAEYLEINPFVFAKDGRTVALDTVLKLDGVAHFRHPDWDFEFSEFGSAADKPVEREIKEIDKKIKGSVKLTIIPGKGKIAILPAGGGASLFTADAVVSLGATLANYCEYSGAPPAFAVEALSDKVFNLPGITDVIVNGGIANFTDVYKTFGGIIAAMKKNKRKLVSKKIRLWVRRGGPNEQIALPMIGKLAEEGFLIEVYDRHYGLTDVVDMAIAAQKKGGSK